MSDEDPIVEKKVVKKEFVQKKWETCAVCQERLRPSEQYVIDRPEGDGFARFDNRPKGPAGWRIGSSGNGRRMFTKMERVVVCDLHALKAQIAGDKAREANETGAKIVSWPRKERFENLCKRRG